MSSNNPYLQIAFGTLLTVALIGISVVVFITIRLESEIGSVRQELRQSSLQQILKDQANAVAQIATALKSMKEERKLLQNSLDSIEQGVTRTSEGIAVLEDGKMPGWKTLEHDFFRDSVEYTEPMPILDQRQERLLNKLWRAREMMEIVHTDPMSPSYGPEFWRDFDGHLLSFLHELEDDSHR